MTFQAYSLLRVLRRCQQCEDYTIRIDPNKLEVETSSIYGHPVSASLKRYKGRLHSMLVALHKAGYLADHPAREPYYTQIPHAGWHVVQDVGRKVCAFLAKSILVPIVVSIITAYLTARISCGCR